MPKTRTSSAVKQRYNEKVYDRVSVVVPKGRKAELKACAESKGESLNGFIIKSIDERIEREKKGVFQIQRTKKQKDEHIGTP